MDFTAGQVLCRQGESGEEFFVIVSGTAEVKRDGRSLRQLGPGDFFGEIALIDHGPRTATVVATSAMRCLVLAHGQFRNVLGQNAAIALAVLEALGRWCGRPPVLGVSATVNPSSPARAAASPSCRSSRSPGPSPGR
jgi:CRP-like cAMP-binding protein